MSEATVTDGTQGRVPVHLWVVGALSLLWNAYGAYDYTMSHLGGLDHFRSAGLDEAAYEWFLAAPAWSIAGWAIGVWFSLAGSLLLLARSRYAATAFGVSFFGAVASFAYQFTSERPASMEGTTAVVMAVIVFALIAGQLYYARRMIAANVLR